jgi:hypothetical protein
VYFLVPVSLPFPSLPFLHPSLVAIASHIISGVLVLVLVLILCVGNGAGGAELGQGAEGCN